MNILLITHFSPPTHTAGTEFYTLGLAKSFIEHGQQVDILCAEDWDHGDHYWNGVTEDVYEGIPVHRIHLNWLKAKNPNRALYDSDLVENWLDNFLTTNHYHVVHVTSALSLGVGILRSVKRSGIPLVLTLMDFWFLCPSIQLLKSDNSLCDGLTTAWQCQSCLMGGSHLHHRMERHINSDLVQSRTWKVLARVPLLTKQRGLRGMLLDMEERKRILSQALTIPDFLISHSEIIREIFSKQSPAPIHLIRNGYSSFRQIIHQRRTPSDVLRFGYIGQIHRMKGVHLLVEAFQQARLEKSACLEIWGDLSRNAEYATHLFQLSGNNPAVKFHGWFDHNQLDEILADIDVLVVPSLWYENAPLAIQEAFIAKIPVITTNLGGMAEEVTHEVNGLLFEWENVNDLAFQLRRCVDDSGLLERLIEGTPQIKTIDKEVSELSSIYQDLIAQKQGTPSFNF